MTATRTAKDILDDDFLQMRHRLLDLAAALDRIQRAEDADSIQSDRRIVQLQEAIRVLVDGKPNRVERVQMTFSLPHDEGWRSR